MGYCTLTVRKLPTQSKLFYLKILNILTQRRSRGRQCCGKTLSFFLIKFAGSFVMSNKLNTKYY